MKYKALYTRVGVMVVLLAVPALLTSAKAADQSSAEQIVPALAGFGLVAALGIVWCMAQLLRVMAQRRQEGRAWRPLVALMIALLASISVGGVALGHNLQTKMVYMFFDPATQTMLDNRIASPSWTPPQPLLQVGDEIGMIIKVVPRDGTTTGVGGYVDFYVPNGVTILDAAYVRPNSSGNYDKIPMKGQSLIAIGDGPVGTNCTPALASGGPLTLGPNILGVTAQAVATTTGCHNGTIAGVYGDVGIFYSTNPDTAYGTWQQFTSDWVAANPQNNVCGALTTSPTANGKRITNNSGDVVVPCNKWDAEQLYAYGTKGTTYTGPGAASTPIVDPNGRGNAPWGNASGVAGPQSGYQWSFDWDFWRTSAMTAANMKTASSEVGPWKRIQYPGSLISKDTPGLKSTVLGTTGVDGSTVGTVVSPATPLTSTTSQTDSTSPKTIRWSVGQLTQLVPEYAWVKFRIDNASSFLGSDGCPYFYGDTFGGDAGGSDTGKDHLWRYYEPSIVKWNGCVAMGKPTNTMVVKSGDTFSYKIKFYNAGTLDLTNVVVKDTLPSGVTFINSVPAQNSGPNPLIWNVGTLLRGQKFEATVTVKATSTGALENNLTVTSNQLPPQTVTEIQTVGSIPILDETKSVTPTSVAPGGNVQYTITVKNVGSGPTASPVTLSEYLPTGFTYVSKDSVTVNGANVTATTTVNATDTNKPIFTIPAPINAGQSLVLKFTALVGASVTSGSYCNQYTVTQNGVPATTGMLACVTVGGGRIGDTIYRDWNGNGAQDAGEEGVAGVTVELRNGVCTPGVNCPTTTTDANGNYVFNGLVAGTYTVVVTDTGGKLTGYTPKQDPDGGTANQSVVVLTANQANLLQDFGYQPAGTGSIGDKVFDDKNLDGVFNGADVGINGVNVTLYKDTNGNGVIDAGDLAIATTTTSGGGNYLFSGLATGVSYLTQVSPTDTALTTYFGATPSGSTPTLQPVSNLAGSYLNADFGFYTQTPGSIGDQVWLDANANGVFDSGETGLGGVTVKLYRDANNDGIADAGEFVRSTTVSGSGTYSFGNLGPDKYIVTIDSTDPSIPSGYYGPYQSNVTLAASQNYTTADFPYVTALSKSVSPTGATTANSTLTYTITPRYPGSDILPSIVVNDTIPAGTTYVNASANLGGEAIDDTDPPDGIIESVNWDLGSNAIGVPGNKGGTPPAACQTTLTLTADADTWIDQANTTTWKGDDSTEDVSSAANKKVGLVHFNVSSSTLPVGATLNSAVLNLTLTGGGGSNRQVNVHNMTTAWTEGTSNTNGATWSDPNGTGAAGVWATSGGSFGSSDYNNTSLGQIDPTNNGTVYPTTVTSTVSGWLTGGTNSGLALIGVGTATNTVSFGSRTNSGKEPQLVITYTPNGCSGTSVIQRTGASGTVFDTDIDKANPTTWASGNNRLRTQPADSNNLRYALVKFDLSSIPAGATINNATMRVEVRSQRSNHVDQIYRLTTDWVPGTSNANGATWNDPNGTGTSGTWAGGAFSASDYNATSLGSITPSTTGAKVLNLTNQVRNWYNSTHANYGLVFVATGTDTGEAVYYSSEEGTVLRRPSLTVDWSISPSNPTGTNTIAAGPTLVQVGDTITVRMTLTDSSGSAVTNVAPSALTVTSVTNGGTATCGSPSPSTVTVPGNGSATITWTCTNASSTANTVGSVKFSASASNGTTSWSVGTSNSVVIARPLTFQVTVKNPPGVNTISNTAAINNGTNNSITSNTTQNPVTASIGDRVWNDINGNGVQDAGEPGLQGVTVCATPTGGGAAVCATTDANGNYRIYGLTNGTSYNVTYTLPGALSSYQPTTSTTLTRTATSAGVNDADFGLRAPASGSIGDTVWLDKDNDGVLDADESGLSNITVKLYQDTNNNGSIDAGDLLMSTKTTDSNGNYSFTGLYAGNYLVQVDTTSAVTTPQGVNTTVGAAMTATTGTTNPKAVTLATNSTVITNADFGYNWGGSIGDYAWYDTSGDTLQNNLTDEGGAPNTTIALYYDTNANGKVDVGESIVAVTTTAANGSYLFSNLPPGNYVVKAEEQQVPAPPSSANAGTIGTMVATTGSQHGVSLAANQTYTAADFGFIEGSEIEGHVFHDVNGNGVLDAGEPRFANVTVTLTGTDLAGNPVSRTTTTDAAGEYGFIVPPGNYTITYNTSDPDIPAALSTTTTPTSYTVSVPAGAEMSGFDFGRDNAGSIGDTIFNDANGNGVQDVGEAGLPGVTVNLYDNSNNYITSAVTDSSGKYLFGGLADGTYKVSVDTTTLPTGYVQKADPDQVGTCTVCDSSSNATISGGNSVLTKDFGYQAPGTLYSVSGKIWNDANGNGVNNSEANITGATVTVTYTDTNNSTLSVTVPVDASGNYSVNGIPNGSTVTVKVNTDTLPNTSYTQTGDPDQPGMTCTTCDSQTTFTIAGANVTGKDFGYQAQVGSISGKVVLGNGNGIADTGEAPLQNVTIKLYYAATLNEPFTLLNSTTTAADGSYSFTNLLPGYYQIVETNPPAYASIGDRDMGSNLDNVTVVLSAGQNVTGRDFEDATPTSLVLQALRVFSAAQGVKVEWTSANELDVIGFNVWRGEGNLLPEQLNQDLIPAISPGQVSGNDYSFDDPNVILGTEYTYQLEIVRAGPLIEWSDPITVTYDGGSGCLNAPDAPKLLMPKSKGTVKKASPTLSWEPAKCDTATYKVVVRQDTAKGKVIASQKDLTDTRLRLKGLKDGETYVWRVQACNGDNLCAWSKWRKFIVKLDAAKAKSEISGKVLLDADASGTPGETDTALENIAVTLLRDPNADGDLNDAEQVAKTKTNTNGEYRFNQLGAGSYVVVMQEANAYQVITDTSAPDDGKIRVTLSKRKSAPDNDFLVRAVETSDTMCATAPDKPTLLLPKDNAQLGKKAHDFTWNAAACETATYTLVVRQENPKGKLLVKQVGLTETTFRVERLQRAKTYVWRVQACTPNNACTWSEWWTFTEK